MGIEGGTLAKLYYILNGKQDLDSQWKIELFERIQRLSSSNPHKMGQIGKISSANSHKMNHLKFQHQASHITSMFLQLRCRIEVIAIVYYCLKHLDVSV